MESMLKMDDGIIRWVDKEAGELVTNCRKDYVGRGESTRNEAEAGEAGSHACDTASLRACEAE